MIVPRPLPLLLASVLLPACGAEVPLAEEAPRTIVLVSLDTLRPERLGLYGGADDTSPHLDALAEESVVFDQALAPAPWTLPSHMTMLTGLDPFAHGVLHGGYRLGDGVTTLAESLAHAGYRTAAFTDGGYVSGFYGFERGFDLFDDERSEEGPNGFPRLLPGALDWLRGQDAQEPVFLFLHTFDAHTPYDEVAPDILDSFRSRPTPDGPDDAALYHLRYYYQQTKVGIGEYHRMSQLLNDYDAGVHEADRGIGELVATLRELGRWDDTLLIVTSDHGEEFLDQDLHVGHGLTLTDAELAVPLVLRLPLGEAGGRRIDTLVGLVDIARTVLETVGVDPDPVTQGESLLGLIRGEERRTDHLVLASQNMRSWGLVKDGFKYVSPTSMAPLEIAKRHLGPTSPVSDEDDTSYLLGPEGGDRVELAYDMVGDPLGVRDVLIGFEQLYDRTADPLERNNVAATDAERAERMNAFLAGRFEMSRALGLTARSIRDDAETGIDASQQRTLAALGYVGGQQEDEELLALGHKMRQWVSTPFVAPDMTAVREIDRAVHRVRVQLLEGSSIADDDAAARLQDAGAEYTRWLERHPDHRARILWRLAALQDLAALADAELDVEAWKALLAPARRATNNR